jgi:hypothetical protein
MAKWTRSDKLAICSVVFAFIGCAAGIFALRSKANPSSSDQRGIFIPQLVNWKEGSHGITIGYAQVDYYQIVGFKWTDSSPLVGCSKPLQQVATILRTNFIPESNDVIGISTRTPTGELLDFAIDAELSHGRLPNVERSWFLDMLKPNRRVLITYRSCQNTLHASEVLAE